MSESLGKALTRENITKKRTSTAIKDPSNMENEEPPAKNAVVTIPTESDYDFNFSADDILQIVEQCEKSTEDFAVTNVNNNNNQLNMTSNLVQRSPNIPAFNNCKIGNIKINIQK